MRRLSVFLSISLDGCFADTHGDMSWAHRDDPEYSDFVAANARSGSELLMGRVTYQMMASYWPSCCALEREPVVAGAMNGLPKVVFSTTLESPNWTYTRLVRTDPADEVRRMKMAAGPDMVVLGSGSIAGYLAGQGLVDEFQFVVVPLVLGGGRTMLPGLTERMPLKLTATRAFANGNVLLTYARG